MSDNKRYFWLKLDENFFEDDTITWIEEQENGKDYVIFYLKLCLKSLSDDGYLVRYVGQKLIPYDVKALSKLTNTSPDTVAVAMNLFLDIGLVSRLDSGEIYMNQINEMIGSETAVAKRVRKHRAKKALKEPESKLLLSNNEETKCNTEKEIEKDKEKEIEKDLKESFEIIWDKYPNKKGKQQAFKSYKKAIKDGVTNEEIAKGIEKYNQEIKIKRTSQEYIKHGSTFFNNRAWEDDYLIASSNDQYQPENMSEILSTESLFGGG